MNSKKDNSKIIRELGNSKRYLIIALNVANQENASKSLINKLNKLCGGS